MPCVCSNGLVPFCTEPRMECACDFENALVCRVKWPDGKCPPDAQSLFSATNRTGEVCRGWIYQTEPNGVASAIESKSTFVCRNACNRMWAVAHGTIAVPGTPCVGYEGIERRTGKWLPIQ